MLLLNFKIILRHARIMLAFVVIVLTSIILSNSVHGEISFRTFITYPQKITQNYTLLAYKYIKYILFLSQKSQSDITKFSVFPFYLEKVCLIT